MLDKILYYTLHMHAITVLHLCYVQYFYMDRVVSGKRQVRRKKPTFIGWSDALILNRQISDISSKIVFHGKIALPLRCKNSDDESSYEV